MYRIGDLWERAEVSVADEHLATAITNRVMSSVYEALAVELPTSKERVLVSAVEGDQHVMGLRMVADVLEGAGYETLFLGIDATLLALIAEIERYQPRVLALGATAPWSGAGLVETIREVRAVNTSLAIVVGGAQAQAAADAVADQRVIVAADATEVLAAVERAIEASWSSQPP